MKCPSCGARGEFSKFCSECGNPLQASAVAETQVPPTGTVKEKPEADQTAEAKKDTRNGCLIMLAIALVVPAFLFDRCVNAAGDRAEERAEEYYSPKSMILDEIDPGEEFEVNHNVFADDSSNYEDALDWCTQENPRDECEAALEEVVGEPVDLEALYAAEEKASTAAESSGGASGGTARFRPSVGDFGAVDSDTIVAEITIRNRGSAAGTASCIATIDNTTGNSGHDIFTTRRIKPGSVYRARVQLATEDGTARVTTGVDLTCS